MNKVKILSLILLSGILLIACTPKQTVVQDVTLNYWSVYEPQENIQEIRNEFQTANPNIKIKQDKKTVQTYSGFTTLGSQSSGKSWL